MGIIQSYLEKIAEINNLDIAASDKGNGKWMFHNGMLFLSPYKWWQDHGVYKTDKRKTAHEGIDILFFKNKNKQIQKLNTDTLIPAATNGKIINLCDDFLGQSIVVLNNSSSQEELDIIFVYAHVLPESSITIGTNLKQDEIIASIADTSKIKTPLPPHLHLSVIEIPKNTPAKRLNWKFFSNRENKINLINPLFI